MQRKTWKRRGCSDGNIGQREVETDRTILQPYRQQTWRTRSEKNGKIKDRVIVGVRVIRVRWRLGFMVTWGFWSGTGRADVREGDFLERVRCPGRQMSYISGFTQGVVTVHDKFLQHDRFRLLLLLLMLYPALGGRAASVGLCFRRARVSLPFFTARSCASAVYAVLVFLSVRHKPVLCRNDWTNRAGFRHGGFLPPIPHCVTRKLVYLQSFGYFPLELCPKLRT